MDDNFKRRLFGYLKILDPWLSKLKKNPVQFSSRFTVRVGSFTHCQSEEQIKIFYFLLFFLFIFLFFKIESPGRTTEQPSLAPSRRSRHSLPLFDLRSDLLHEFIAEQPTDEQIFESNAVFACSLSNGDGPFPYESLPPPV